MSDGVQIFGRTTEPTNHRNYGIDALRIVSMIMIVTLHVLGHGGVLSTASVGSAQYNTAWLIEAFCFCSVNCYALISGYVGLFSKYRISNLILLWIRVAFYTILFAIVFKMINPQSSGTGIFIFQFFPLLSGQYWYFNAYFILFLFVPLLNNGLNSLSKKQMQFLIISIILFLSVLMPVIKSLYYDVFNLNDGYSAWWLMILYLIGGYIRKYSLFKSVKSVFFLLFFLISSLLTWGSKICIQFVSKTFLGEIKYDDMFFSYSSITVLLAAIFLFLFFERIYLNKIWIRAITLFAPLTFSVYLIHENYYIREFFIVDRFKWIAELPLYQMIPTLICIVLLIYFLCSVVDFIRSSLFKTIKIKKRITRLDNSVFKF